MRAAAPRPIGYATAERTLYLLLLFETSDPSPQFQVLKPPLPTTAGGGTVMLFHFPNQQWRKADVGVIQC